MLGLLIIGYAAGVIAGVSPCVLPILPVVFVGWATPVPGENTVSTRRRRSLWVVAGVVISFSVATAAGSALLSIFGLPQTLLHNVGVALLILFGVGLLVPKIAHLLERPFQRVQVAPRNGTRSGFWLGIALGLVFVPCAGPILAAVSVLDARHRVSFSSLLLSFVFALGAATPLVAIALSGERLLTRNTSLSARIRRWRPAAGVVLIALALAVSFNWVASFQRALPSYTQSLQNFFEGNGFTSNALRQLQGEHTTGSLVTCENLAAEGRMAALNMCGTAPHSTGITGWLNTPGDHPVSQGSLRGHVVLVDFWTYSCINCQRTLPHVEAWYRMYHRYGLDIIGVEAPEFAFEHSPANIAAAAKALGVNYPIAIDDNLATWNAYENEYWPAEYLIDAKGVVRHVAYGEGNYAADERDIRTLLVAAHPGLHLPPASNVPDQTPTELTSPETYLGTERSQYLETGSMANGRTQQFNLITPSRFGYTLGGTWTPTTQYITAGTNARLALSFEARHVYLVLGGSGSVQVSVNGEVRDIKVSGYPTLYTLASFAHDTAGILHLAFSPGVQAYDFTFG